MYLLPVIVPSNKPMLDHSAPEQAMSALSTHDMPTILGWWNHEDLKLGLKLGLYNEQQAHDIGEGRYQDQQRILDSLHGLGSVGDKVPSDGRNCPMSPELLEGAQRSAT